MIKVAAWFSLVASSAAVACGDDPREEASQYATDPVACAQDSDCCVVNDGCQSTAYLVASKDASKVASLIASADGTTCNRCITPMLQVSCVSGACVGERINITCALPMPYPGNHCGRVDVPSSCLSSPASHDALSKLPTETSKPLAIFKCGG